MTSPVLRSMGRTDLPPEQREAIRKAIRWEWFTIGYTAVTIVLIALVVGGSQAISRWQACARAG